MQRCSDSILKFIRDQHLVPGDKLPSEAALAGSLGVGRKTVREALSALQAIGAVESQMGSGWFVTKGTAEAAARAFHRSLTMERASNDGCRSAQDPSGVRVIG